MGWVRCTHHVFRCLRSACITTGAEHPRSGYMPSPLIMACAFSFRISAQVFALIYVVGILAARFAPETKDRPRVED